MFPRKRVASHKTHAVFIAGSSIFGAMIGFIVNVNNYIISPDYFINVLQLWQYTEPQWFVFRQGLLEGGLFGCLLALINIIFHSGERLNRKTIYSNWIQIPIRLFLISSCIGLTYSAVNIMYRRFQHGMSDISTMVYLYRLILVQSSIWGWYIAIGTIILLRIISHFYYCKNAVNSSDLSF